MAEVSLRAARRHRSGKGVARKTRAAGKVPAVVYGQGMESMAIEVDRRELVTALHTDAGMNVLLNLEIEDDRVLALTRELQTDPVRGSLLHADFIKVDRTHAVEVEVPIHIVGEAPGAKEGGVLEHPLFTVHVRCLPTEVPEGIDADVSSLGIGDSLRVSDLSAAARFEILNDPDTVVASVVASISEEELEAMEAAAAAPEGVEDSAAAAEEAPVTEDAADDSDDGGGSPEQA
jgi:large subunit ribosomal protein L25